MVSVDLNARISLFQIPTKDYKVTTVKDLVRLRRQNERK